MNNLLLLDENQQTQRKCKMVLRVLYLIKILISFIFALLYYTYTYVLSALIQLLRITS